MEPSNHTARISLSAILAVLLYIPGLAASQANTSSLEDTTLDQLEQRLSTIDKELSNLAEFSLRGGVGSIGFRSYWHRNPEVREWVKVDLNREGPIDSIVLVPTIWRTMKDGFQSDGFPLAFRIYAGKKGEDEGRLIAEFNEPREFLPRVAPMVIPVDNVTAAWVKIETLRLSNRKYDEKPAFQLAELLVFDRRENVALLQPVTTSSNFGSYSGAWHKRFLTDGFMPYLMNSTRGEPSRAFVTVPGERPEITIDLGKAFSLSGVNFHTIEQSDTVPQAYAGDLGIPANLQIWGSLDREFSNPTLLFHHREASIDINGPIIMRDIPNLNARYVRITPQGTATPGNSSEKFRIGFAEIELLSGGRNVARGKTVEMNTTLLPHQSPLKALTDGRNLYGKILPVRTWMEELAKRHELERERPRVTAEIARRYSKQKSRLQIMTWVAVVSLAGLTILILIERNLRLKNTVKIKQRIAANLHDELGANLHAIGMLGRHASRMDHTSREQSETVARICEIAERTSNATHLNLPGMSGHSSIPWFRQQAPDAEIIVLTQSDKEKDVMKAVHLGASGYLLKTALIDNIRDSIINVHKGGGSLDPKIAKMLMSQLDYSSLDGEEINITTREVEILKLLAEGLQKKEIATHLDIAIATVNTHIKNIYIKLDLDAPSAEKALLEFISATYSSGPPDLVVPVSALAAAFCADHQQSLFQGAPILALSMDKRRFTGIAGKANITCVGYDLDLKAYIENIRKTLPETRQIYVLMGHSPFERYWEKQLRSEWTAFEKELTFHWLGDKSLAEICEITGNLPANSAIFVGMMNWDSSGVFHESETALNEINQRANAPIFGYAEPQMGLGIVGGPLVPSSKAAAKGAEVALTILAGKSPRELEALFFPLSEATFDWRELQTWKIPPRRLPAEARILFEPPGLWESHRNKIIFVTILILALILLVITLLAARKKARRMDESLTLAAEAAQIGLWRREANTGKIYASAQWCRIFGLPEGGPVEISTVRECLHPDDRDAVINAIEEAASTGGRFDLEHRIVRPDGSVRWLTSHGRSEATGNGRGSGSSHGASMDITERREAEATSELHQQELAHLSRVSTLGVLSGALAHELNQPLGIILSNAQAAEYLLESDQPDLTELKAIIADIIDADRRAGEVIKRLRALLRRGDSTPHYLDVNRCIAEVLKILNSDLIRRGISVRTTLSPHLPDIFAENVQLQQVLMNLITNGCDAMDHLPPEQRRMEIKTLRESDEVLIVVTDEGAGLPEDVEEIFQPFQTSKSQGLGLGLTICRALITAHNGRLWAENGPLTEEFLSAGKKQDLGCAVLDLSMPGIDGLQLQEKLRLTRCNLPVIFLSGDGDIPATVTAIKGGAINFLTKPVDVTDLTDAIRLALMEGEKARARAERQNDLRQSRGTDLLEACSDGCISAVILDLHMPVMNGFDVLKKMKRTPDKPPVIVITGHDQVGNEDTVLQLGALAYLTKPIDKKPLLDLLFTVASPPPR
eukprot:g3738.t1